MKDEELLSPLSEAQTEIMNLIWEQGEATLVSICDSLSQRRDLARNTVQTQLTRLVAKGWLLHRSEGKAFWYRAAFPQAVAQKMAVQRVVETMFDGSTEGLVLSLLDGGKLSAREVERIRSFIDKFEEGEKP